MGDLTEAEQARARLMQTAGVANLAPEYEEVEPRDSSPPTLDEISAVVTRQVAWVLGSFVVAFAVLLVLIGLLAGGLHVTFGSG